MLEVFVVTLREGIEAFLIVAIALAILRKDGRAALASAVHAGAALAVAASVALGVFLAGYAMQPLWESVLAATAAVLVLSMVIYMLRHARHMRTDISNRLQGVTHAPGAGAWVGVFLFTLLMITREGMEAAFVVGSLAGERAGAALIGGALAGIAAAAALAWAWSRYGHRVNLGLFFQVTSIFLVLFSVQLLIYAFHEATEAGVLPIDNAYWHIATEPYGPEGPYGQWLTFGLVVVPLAWLIASRLRGLRAKRAGALRTA
ncbi:MAG: FTR1 family protein [Burkholderiales bacterium]|nr:FTR1 family protein [Burkholderiales bacterium]